MFNSSKAKQPELDLSVFSKAKDLKKRLLFVLLALIVCRVGAYIPLPGIDANVLQEVAAQNSGGLLGMFNMLSGGSLGRMTIFALAIVPYITSSIIMQLLTVVSEDLKNLKKDSEQGRQKINQYTRYLTVILCSIQGFGIAVGLEHMNGSYGQVVLDPGLLFRITTTVSLLGGTMFLMWLGEQITIRGIGNGVSLIIFTSIVAGLPRALISTLELGRTGALSALIIIGLIALAIVLVGVIVFMEKSYRKIPVQYPKRQVGNKMYAGDASSLPLKLNTAGVIPPIFASSILLFPMTIANFSANSDSLIFELISRHLSHGKPFYLLAYALLMIFFCFFYTSVVFNSKETADNLKKYGGFIPGYRPGSTTAAYLDYVLTRITVIGASYITLICIIPEMLIAHFSVPFYLGGTSILIVVNVVMDTIVQIQTHLFTQQYEKLMNKANLRGRRR